MHPGMVAKLSRWEHVIIATDPDQAGRRVARQLKAALGNRCMVEVLALPEGSDPNSMLPEMLTEYLEPMRLI